MTDQPAAARILIVEDEAPIRRFRKIGLGSAGYAIIEAERGRQGVELAASAPPDLVVLDLGLPDKDAKAVITAIREWSRVPIMSLSVRDGEADKIPALDAGADDYVTKPFAAGEANAAEVSVGGHRIKFATRALMVDGNEVKLTRKEFDVLAILARHAGRPVGHRYLLTTIWGPAHVRDTHYLRIVIGPSRDELGDDADDPRFIVTEPGVGYRLVADWIVLRTGSPHPTGKSANRRKRGAVTRKLGLGPRRWFAQPDRAPVQQAQELALGCHAPQQEHGVLPRRPGHRGSQHPATPRSKTSGELQIHHSGIRGAQRDAWSHRAQGLRGRSPVRRPARR